VPSLLFVCTANQCRSPIAEALFEDRLVRSGLAADWRVGSAATWSVMGMPAAAQAQRAARERGLDLANHRSRIVNRELLTQFDLVLVMERSHKEALRLEFPEVGDRVHLLSELAGAAYDIKDPMGLDRIAFRETLHELEHLIDLGFEKIIELAQANEAD
jgi:protein-tyrosine-phosphatase